MSNPWPPNWPSRPPPGGRLHLRPLPRAAADAPPDARSLAGGPLAFDAAELILATPGAPTARAVAPLAAIEAWASRAGLADPVAARLRRLAAAPVAPGLPAARPLIVAVVNVTPDSFSDGGRHLGAADAIAAARTLRREGADIVELGAESTRPGAEPVPAALQLKRLLPVLEGLTDLGAPLAVDTRSAEVMRRAVAAGAGMVNDVSGFRHDPDSLAAVAALPVPVVLMHSRGTPAEMQRLARYDDVLLEVHEALAARLEELAAAGVAAERVIVDPGFGFAKTAAHNLALLAGLALLHGLGRPLLAGLSRKSFIGRLSRDEPPERRLAGSLAAALSALDQGAQLLRVHDVAETAQAVALWRALRGAA